MCRLSRVRNATPCAHAGLPEHVLIPATWYPARQMESWWGPLGDPAEDAARGTRPDGAFLAGTGRVLLPGHMDRRMVGYHGGLDPREVRIPLLVAATA